MRKFEQYTKFQMLDWTKKEATMAKLKEEPTIIGEVACIRNAQTGDYSLSLHDAVAELTAANRRLQTTIDDLLNKIECLRCGTDLQDLGFA